MDGINTFFLVDFGLCCDFHAGPRQQSLGSPYWIPPEMLLRQPHHTPVRFHLPLSCDSSLAGRHPNKNPPIFFFPADFCTAKSKWV